MKKFKEQADYDQISDESKAAAFTMLNFIKTTLSLTAGWKLSFYVIEGFLSLYIQNTGFLRSFVFLGLSALFVKSINVMFPGLVTRYKKWWLLLIQQYYIW